jgi:hypothetical protein
MQKIAWHWRIKFFIYYKDLKKLGKVLLSSLFSGDVLARWRLDVWYVMWEVTTVETTLGA